MGRQQYHYQLVEVEEQMWETMHGTVYLNDEIEKKIELAMIDSRRALTEATRTILGTKVLTKVEICFFRGNKQTANKVLQFIAERIDDGRLTEIKFDNWDGSASEIHAQTLSLIAAKAQALTSLQINSMSGATEAGKHALASFAADIVNQSPLLEYLSLYYTYFESSDLDAVRDALVGRNIGALTKLYLDGNPAGFDSDTKCKAWTAVLRNMSGLKGLYLRDCNAVNEEAIKTACPKRCRIMFKKYYDELDCKM